MYKININDSSENIAELSENNCLFVKNQNGNNKQILNKGISCEIISPTNYDNKLLACFTEDQESFSLVATICDPEDELSFKYYSENVIGTSGCLYINSALSPNKKNCIVCLVDNRDNLYCLIYNSETNQLSEIINFIEGCQINAVNNGIQCISEKQEYSAYCYSSSMKMNLIKFDRNFKVKDKSEDNEKCYTQFDIFNDPCYTIKSCHLLYVKPKEKYFLFRTCLINENIQFNLLSIPETCNIKIEKSGFESNDFDTSSCDNPNNNPNTNNNDDTNTNNESISSTLTLSSTISTIRTKVESTFLNSLISTTINSTMYNAESSSITSTSLDSPSTLTSFPSALIYSPSTVIALLSTFINSHSTLIPLTSTLIYSPSTIISIPSTLEDSSSSTIEYPSTLIKTPSTLIEISSILKPLPSTVIIESISSISSFPTSPESTIFLSKDFLLHTNKIEIESSKIPTSLVLTELIASSEINGNIMFSIEGNILKGKTDKNKEEIKNSLDDIMEAIEIGKQYIIIGGDYNITVTPINETNSLSSFADFSLCEEILRKEYKLRPDEILTILQIEIDKMNEKALTNQIEYAIYDEVKRQLNLSYCKKIEIKIIYDIKNDSLLNQTMISYFSEFGIDIFNRNDSFFNDLCYPFSVSNSDVILQDRLLDIYQNFSLCDDGCEYDEIDMENMSVTCSCKVKTEINTEISELKLGKIVQTTFQDSNLGVIRCYNLVFSLKNKLHNYGFFISLFFFIIHIICYIYYFIKGIKSIVIFVFKEMEKNNYITKVYYPNKKKQSRNNPQLKNNSNVSNDFNSVVSINNEDCNLRNSLKKIKKLNNAGNQPVFIFNYKYNNNYYKLNNKSIIFLS